LAALIAPHLSRPIRPVFVVTDLLTDQAEYTLLHRRRFENETCELPQSLDSPASQPQAPTQLPELSRLVSQLAAETRLTVPLEEVVPWATFEESAYRLSMLPLLGDAEAAASDAPVRALAALPYTLAVSGGDVPVGRAGVATLTVGELQRLAVFQTAALDPTPERAAASPPAIRGQEEAERGAGEARGREQAYVP
jgi:hypothetical protein